MGKHSRKEIASDRFAVGDRIYWDIETTGTVAALGKHGGIDIVFDDDQKWSFGDEELDQFVKVEPRVANKSRGYHDDDVVLVVGSGAVLRYSEFDDSWYSAGPEGYAVSDLEHAEVGEIKLLVREDRAV